MRVKPIATALSPAPLTERERADVITDILRGHGVMVRRMGFAHSTGITITYVHLSERADCRGALRVLAETLTWADTDLADAAGSVAVTTHRG